MGVSEVKRQALLLVGASGGVGVALLEYLSSRTPLVCIPTYYRKKPQGSDFSWIHYNSSDIESTRTMFEEISREYDVVLVIDASGEFFASKIKIGKTGRPDFKAISKATLSLSLRSRRNQNIEIGGDCICDD